MAVLEIVRGDVTQSSLRELFIISKVSPPLSCIWIICSVFVSSVGVLIALQVALPPAADRGDRPDGRHADPKPPTRATIGFQRSVPVTRKMVTGKF